MAEFIGKKLNLENINSGNEFVNGDGFTPTDINNIIEGIQFLTENIEPSYIITVYTDPFNVGDSALNKEFTNNIYSLRHINSGCYLMIVKNNYTQPEGIINLSVQTIFDGTQYFTRTLSFDENGNFVSTVLSSKKTYLTNEDGSKFQLKTIKSTNITVSSWTKDMSYTDFPYSASIPISGVNSNDVANVIFGNTEAMSGNYSPVCQTLNGSVKIYSKANTSITIPTILVEVF